MENSESHILVGRGRPYHFSAITKLKDYLNKTTPEVYSLTSFSIHDNIYGYRNESHKPEEKDASLKRKSEIIDEIKNYIIEIAEKKNIIESLERFKLKGEKYQKYFRGIPNNPWTSILGGRMDEADKSEGKEINASIMKHTAIREFMEETDLVFTCWDAKFIGYHKERNEMREKFYKKALEHTKCFYNKKNIYLFALEMDKKDVLQIKNGFSSVPRIFEETSGKHFDPKEKKFIEGEGEEIEKVFKSRITEYRKISRNMLLEKRELVVVSFSELQTYFEKRGELYEEDKQYVKKWVINISKFFIYLLNNEFNLEEQFKEKLNEEQLFNNLEKVFRKHIDTLFEENRELVRHELEEFKKYAHPKTVTDNRVTAPASPVESKKLTPMLELNRNLVRTPSVNKWSNLRTAELRTSYHTHHTSIWNYQKAPEGNWRKPATAIAKPRMNSTRTALEHKQTGSQIPSHSPRFMPPPPQQRKVENTKTLPTSHSSSSVSPQSTSSLQ